MPLCALYLLALTPQTSLTTYLHAVRAHLPPPARPLVTARPIRWIILPSTLTAPALLNPLNSPYNTTSAADAARNPPTTTPWDLLLILPTAAPLPPPLLEPHLVRASFTLQLGIPSAIAAPFPAHNARLLTQVLAPPPTQGSHAPLLAADAQTLEATPALLDWARDWAAQRHRGPRAGPQAAAGPVSMLNLLAFRPGAQAKADYAAYGRAFAEGAGSRRGGEAKVVGKVAGGADAGGEGGWEEAALAQYPSLDAFLDMAGSEDYQAVNWRLRLKALRDTCILMTTEVDEEIMGVAGSRGARL